MAKQMTGINAKLRATLAILGFGVLGAMMLWSAGCSRNSSDYSQFPANAEGLFLSGMRPPAGDINRLLRNAHYLKLMGRPEMALRELEAAYQQDPRNIKVLNSLALACDEMGEFSRAQKLYQEALALDVSNQALNNNLCFSYYLAGQWDKAETCFRQALSRNPQNIMARNNLGLLLCRRGRTEEARRLWEDAEGQVAAQRKMQQVMVALGVGDTSHYAQVPKTAPVASAPLPETRTPSTPVQQDTASPKMAQPKPIEPQPQIPVRPPSKTREPVKMAANSGPVAVSPEVQPQKSAALGQKERQPAAAKPLAYSSPAANQKKPASLVLVAAPTKKPSPPPRPKRTADTDKKPAPAATPPPPSKPGKIKVAATPSPQESTPEKATPSGIEVANATGAFNLARRTRAKLKDQGFKVVTISNNHGRRSDDTVIYYRPEAEKVARALSAKFFSQCRLEIGEKFARNTNIKVVLGQDILSPPPLADKSSMKAEKIAAGPGPQRAESPPATAPTVTPVAAQPSKPAPVKAAARKNRAKSYLTTEELLTMAIEIRNGSGAHNIAHKARSMLSEEGFNVARIGNHIDFGADKTIIYYRSGAEKMARNLRSEFFPNSQMEQTAKLPEGIAVKVLLGKDLLQRTEVMAKLGN
ncbi:MAG: LytR C-terminal domain-containing protein [Thermodesulfobacteriota bacterium]